MCRKSVNSAGLSGVSRYTNSQQIALFCPSLLSTGASVAMSDLLRVCREA